MNQEKPYVITIVGPESSGKTTLARELAAFYRCPWVPEFAREYLEALGRPYDLEDLEDIAKGQLAAFTQQLTVGSRRKAVSNMKPAEGGQHYEESSARFTMDSNNAKDTPEFLRQTVSGTVLTFKLEEYSERDRPMLIVDSGMLSIRLWARIKYGISLPLVEEALKEDMTSVYILCRPVLSWEADPLREAPSLLERAWIYNHYLKEVSVIQAK